MSLKIRRQNFRTFLSEILFLKSPRVEQFMTWKLFYPHQPLSSHPRPVHCCKIVSETICYVVSFSANIKHSARVRNKRRLRFPSCAHCKLPWNCMCKKRTQRGKTRSGFYSRLRSFVESENNEGIRREKCVGRRSASFPSYAFSFR